MPMDGFTLMFLERELRDALLGARVERVNQPERDAALLSLHTPSGNRKLLLSANANQARAQLTAQTYENPAEPPMFCMLMRKHLTGSRLCELRQLGGDRILRLTFEGVGELGDMAQKSLYLEMMGRYSNLTLTDENGVILDCLRHVNSEMSRVRTLLPGGRYELPPAQDKLAPEALDADALAEKLAGLSCAADKALMATISGMASVCAREACAQLGVERSTPVSELDVPAFARSVVAYYESLPGRVSPVVLQDETGLALDFFAFPYRTFDQNAQKPCPTVSAAMDAFYLGRDLRLRMQQRSAGLQKHIKTAIERMEKKKGIMLETLRQSEQAEQNRVFGELLTANLHRLARGSASVKLVNYYDPAQGEVEIPLSTQLTPAKNAQNYYKKYRKAKVAEQYATEQLVVIERELAMLDEALTDLENCSTSADLGEIRYLLTESGYLRPDPAQKKRKKLAEGKPYRFVAPDGTVIEVGKNALQNDRLTLHARGDETWLHAQGIPGSHVIVRTEEEPAEETLLYAAKLAAYFSKGRNHPSLPVDYTRRKYVKKGAGAPAGLVIYNRFKTLNVGLAPEELVSIAKRAAE